KFVGLIGKMFANTVGARFVGLIDMDAGGRLARTGAPDIGGALHALAHGVVEDDNAIGLQRRLQKSFHSGVVDASHFLVVVEILDDGGMADQRKTFAVQREVAGDQARIEDRDVVRFGQRGRFGFARRRIEGVGAGFSRRRREIVQLGRDERKRFEFCLLQAHGGLLDSIVCSVSSWSGRGASQGVSENSNDAIPGSRKREKSLSKAAAETTIFPLLTRSSSPASGALQSRPLADGITKRPV